MQLIRNDVRHIGQRERNPMGMYATLVEVTPEEAQALRRDPSEVNGLLGIGPDQPGLIGRLFGKKAVEAPNYSVEWGPLESRTQVDLDKNWSVLHTLLTGGDLDAGKGQPEGFIAHGGSEIGDVDVGYGPAQLIDTKEAAQILGVLEHVDQQWIECKWDVELFKSAESYPSVWSDLDEEDAQMWREDLLAAVGELKSFLARVVERKTSVVLWVW